MAPLIGRSLSAQMIEEPVHLARFALAPASFVLPHDLRCLVVAVAVAASLFVPAARCRATLDRAAVLRLRAPIVRAALVALLVRALPGLSLGRPFVTRDSTTSMISATEKRPSGVLSAIAYSIIWSRASPGSHSRWIAANRTASRFIRRDSVGFGDVGVELGGGFGHSRPSNGSRPSRAITRFFNSLRVPAPWLKRWTVESSAQCALSVW